MKRMGKSFTVEGNQLSKRARVVVRAPHDERKSNHSFTRSGIENIKSGVDKMMFSIFLRYHQAGLRRKATSKGAINVRKGSGIVKPPKNKPTALASSAFLELSSN
jgi:hypothetical protein